MKGGETLTFEGFKELDAALTELPRATGKNVARKALFKAAEPIAEAARQNVAVRSGKLQKSITVSTKLANKVGNAEFAAAMQSGQGKAAAVAAMRSARSASGGGSGRVEVHVGAGQLPHAHLIEFGSSRQAPQPYLRPAFDAHSRGAVEILKVELRIEIDKAVARIARKQARLIAKNGA